MNNFNFSTIILQEGTDSWFVGLKWRGDKDNFGVRGKSAPLAALHESITDAFDQMAKRFEDTVFVVK